MTVTTTVLDREIYTEAGAARLLRLGPGTLHYWLEGGNRRGKRYKPVIRKAATGRLLWPERLGAALFDALLGLRVTRPSYLKHTALDGRTATRDLVRAADLGLLAPKGERRGRHYLAGEPLTAILEELRRARAPLVDPYPTLADEIRRAR